MARTIRHHDENEFSVTEGIFKYDKERGMYFVQSDLVPIKVRKATKTDLIYYHKNEYKKIFDEYEKEDNIVIREYWGGKEFAILRRDRLKTNKKEDSDEIEPGFYQFEFNQEKNKWGIKPVHEVLTDKYIDLGLEVQKIEQDMKLFFDSKEIYESHKMVHKRGALAYGPPGNGKTVSSIHATKQIIEQKNAIAFLIHDIGNFPFANIANQFSQPLKGKNKIFIIEEITERDAEIDELLSFLDGELSWENIYTIATTNYPEKLEKNIVDRPGRFDQIIHVKDPDFEQRKKYLEKVTKKSYTDEEIRKTKGYSIAYLKELALKMELYGKSLKEVCKEFDELKKNIEDAFPERGSQGIGF